MVLEPTAINVLTGIGIAVLANIIYGVSGWLKSGDTFNARKFAATIITALVVGTGAGILAVPNIEAVTNQTALIVIYAGLFTAPIVVDVFRTNISGATANRAVEKVEEAEEEKPPS